MSDPLFDEAAAGRYLGGEGAPITDRTMQRWRETGTGPTFVKVGRFVRYRKSDLDAFLDGRRFDSIAAAKEKRRRAAGPDRSAA